ncbi:MAG: ribosome-binding factor A [Kiritimatiellia bacterium]
MKRVNEQILRELSTGLYRVGQGQGIDFAKISFLEVYTSPDLHTAQVVVSVLGSAEDAVRTLAWLKENRIAFQSHLAKTVGLKYTPILHFRQTKAIEKGTRVLSILDELDIPQE